MRMIPRLLLCMILGLSLAACSSPAKKKKEADKAKLAEETAAMADMANDVDFQAFIGTLRKAVAAHDVQTIASLMTPNFGYRLDPVAEGDGVFQYWDDELLWPQLQSVLNDRFAPKGNFMVAPAAFATDPNYHGYRAGFAPVDGAWKFVYFVTD